MNEVLYEDPYYGLIREMSREALESKILDLFKEKDRLNVIINKLEDEQPAKHGRWVPQGDDMWLCSNCKENIIFSMHESDRTEKQRFCCRCGARMDGDIDG